MWQPPARYLVFRGAGYTRPSSRILRECRSIAWVDTSVSERQSLRHGYRRKAAGTVGSDPVQLDDVTPLAERGLSIIPVKFRDKRPATRSWKPFQSRRPTKSQLRGWFDNGGNLNAGIVTGKISDVVVVDLDSPEAIAWADANLPPTAMATKTPRGEHRFFRHPGATDPQQGFRVKTGELPAWSIDAEPTARLWIVAPGSVHESALSSDEDRRARWRSTPSRSVAMSWRRDRSESIYERAVASRDKLPLRSSVARDRRKEGVPEASTDSKTDGW